MCGIFGIWNKDGAPVDLHAVKLAVTMINHRGPDDEGYLLVNTKTGNTISCGGKDTASRLGLPKIESFFGQHFDFVLGHRRLSIIDLSTAGHQPMCNENGTIWIIHNGEIYNYPELRVELRELGHRFLSQTDTEVILHAYEEWGEDCLSRFNGMWAFLILDTRTQRLFAARDRFGVKPLYYWELPGQVTAFTSEVKQLTVLPGFRSGLNIPRVYDFLVHGIADHTPETLFSSVNQLRGGEYLLLSLDRTDPAYSRIGVRRWWDLDREKVKDLSFNRASERFLDLLSDSVRIRLRSDVPVGSCLSGGLDSSSIVCLMDRILRERKAQSNQKTFSSCFNVPEFDEREYIEAVINKTGTQRFFVFPDPEHLFDSIGELTWQQDEPFGSTSIYAQWRVFEKAHEKGVHVLLDGQGADEYLAGYESFERPLLTSLFYGGRIYPFLRETLSLYKTDRYRPSRMLRTAMSAIAPFRAHQTWIRHFHREKIPKWVDFRWWRVNGTSENPSGSGLGAKTAESFPEERRHELFRFPLPALLHWEDRSSMSHSVEARTPFLDYRLVSFVHSLPDDFIIRNGVKKFLLRAAMSNILPEYVRERKDKMGFVTPERMWLLSRPEFCRSLLVECADLIGAGIKKAELLQWFDDLLAGKEPFSFALWRLVNFVKWSSIFHVHI